MTLEETFGSVRIRHKPDDFEDVIEQAKENRARKPFGELSWS
jgi:hypothetical protein